MLILPIILAGILMLSVLNPRFTVTLVQQTLSEAGLLLIDASRRQAASSRYLLGRLPWISMGKLEAPSILPMLPAPPSADSPEVLPGRGQTVRMASSSIWAATLPTTFCHAISTVTSVYLPVAAQILIICLLLFFLRRIATGMVRSLRLPRPSSATLKPVEDPPKQPHGGVLTPSSSQEACGSCDGNTSCHSWVITGSPSDVGLRGISGAPLAISSPVREVNEDPNSPNLQ